MGVCSVLCIEDYLTMRTRPHLPLSPFKVGRSGWWCDHVILELDYFEKKNELICTPNFVCKLESSLFLSYLAKNPMKSAFFYVKNHFLPIFYTQNDHFSIFEGMFTF